MADTSTAIGFHASISIEGKQFDLKEISYGIQRKVDERGSPTDAPKLMMIRMLIDPKSNDEFDLLYDWALAKDTLDMGVVEFRVDENSPVVRRIEFREAVCLGFKEQFQSSQLTTFRGLEQVNVPDFSDYLPSYRRKSYFLAGRLQGNLYEMAVLPKSIMIDHLEIL